MKIRLEHTPDIWHDITEICDFLSCLSVVNLYRFDGSKIYLNGHHWLTIRIYYRNGDGLYHVNFVNSQTFPRR